MPQARCMTLSFVLLMCKVIICKVKGLEYMFFGVLLAI